MYRDKQALGSGQRAGVSAKRYQSWKWIGATLVLLVFLGAAPLLAGAKTVLEGGDGGSEAESWLSQTGAQHLTFEASVPLGNVVQSSSLPPDFTLGPATPLAPGLANSIEGINFNEDANNTGFFHIPPDPMGAAGLNHVVSVVNTSIEWHTKSGVQQNSQSLNSFFSSLAPATATFDPKVIYDQFEDRFVVVTLERTDTARGDASNTSLILLAVSDDGDPNGDWYFHKINALTSIDGSDTWADYPGFALDEEAIYITNNMFTFGNAPAGKGVRLWIVEKGVTAGFYAGLTTSVNIYDPYGSSGFDVTTQPAHVFDMAPTGLGTFLAGYSGLTGSGNEFLQVMRIDSPLSSPTFTLQFVQLGNIDNTAAIMPDAPQAGTSEKIETNDRRALHAIWRDDSLWVTTTVVPSVDPDSGQATAHWIRINTSDLTTLSLADQGNIGGENIASNAHTFFPSVAVDPCGNAGFGFSASAATIFGGAYYTVRYASDVLGSVQPSETVAAGMDYFVRKFGGTRNRWGDYSGASLDPASEAAFWVFNEYALTRGNLSNGEDGRWGTRHGQFDSGIDFGDLPAGYGITRFVDDGARHCIGSPALGQLVDPDRDGQESAESNGDDGLDSNDDEDGVTVNGSWQEGIGTLEIEVSGGKGCISGWIDFNRDNDFSGSGEQVAANLPVGSGIGQLDFTLPVPVSGQTIQARFRLVDDQDDNGICSDQPALGLTGLAKSGEVEDYQWSFPAPAPVAPNSVAIVGPDYGLTGSTYSFEAAAGPISVTLPLTYTWQASGQAPVVTSSTELTHTVDYSWTVSGTYPITVTANNEAGEVSSSHLITISLPSTSPVSVTIEGPAMGELNREIQLVASVAPISVTTPLTYTWQTEGQTPIVNRSSAITNAVTIAWDSPGLKMVMVTVENESGKVSVSLDIQIGYQIYLPVSRKE